MARWIVVIVVASFCSVASMAQADHPVEIRSKGVRMTFDTEGMPRLASLMQQSNSRELIAATESNPVFRVGLGQESGKTTVLTAAQATKGSATRVGDGWELTWQGFGNINVVVHATIKPADGPSGVAMQLSVDNESGLPIRSVSFPVIACKLPLSGDGTNEAVLFPRHEGVLLREPLKHFTREGMWEVERYPGHASTQLLAYYDKQGGVYVGAHDGDGHSKEFRVRRGSNAFELTIVHLEAATSGNQWTQSYPVVVDAFEGDWHAAADRYRVWSRQQSWCGKRITERDVAPWLLEGAGFYNYPAQARSRNNTPMPFYPPTKAANAMAMLHDELDSPVVSTPFSWEKQSVWIGPDYFPPRGGNHEWREMTKALHDNGDRSMVFLSGFRWGLTKPDTDIDNTEAFEERGKVMAVHDRDGKVVTDERKWATNALLCVGSKPARELLADCFRKAYELGIDVVQLDQNVGGDVEVCYAEDHDHPRGVGQWQSEAMSMFLADVRHEAKKHSVDNAMSLEEPCELYIPYLDIYHGRTFTYEHWPITGKGSISVPLFTYLYHPYMPGYAGWVGGGFDLPGRVHVSIGRAFIFGMLVGVRTSVWVPEREDHSRTSVFAMWKDAIHLQKDCKAALLLGDMQCPPELRGGKQLRPKRRAAGRDKAPLPLIVDTVQATSWLGEDGCIWYAIANVEAASAEVEIRLPTVSSMLQMKVERFDPESRHVVSESITAGEWLKIKMKPFGLCCLRMSPVSSDTK